MSISKLREMDGKQLNKELDSQSKKLFNLKLSLANGDIKNTAEVRQVRRDIARIKTVLNQTGEEGNQDEKD